LREDVVLISLDHDDFAKTRRALFVTSVTTLIVSSSNIIDGPIRISGLEILVEQQNLVFWLKAAVIYFLFVFFVRLADLFEKRSLDQARVRFKESQMHIEEDRHINSRLDSFDAMKQHETQEFQRFEMRVLSRQFYYFLMSEAAPALAIAIVAIVGIPDGIKI